MPFTNDIANYMMQANQMDNVTKEVTRQVDHLNSYRIASLLQVYTSLKLKKNTLGAESM